MASRPLPPVVLPPAEYRALWWRLYVRQSGKCAACGTASPTLQIHHESGRGIGGGFRRDVIDECKLLCREDHPRWDAERKPKETA